MNDAPIKHTREILIPRPKPQLYMASNAVVVKVDPASGMMHVNVDGKPAFAVLFAPQCRIEVMVPDTQTFERQEQGELDV